MFKGFNGEAVDHLLSVIAKHGRPLNILVINGTVDDVKAKIAIAVNNRRQVARRRPRLEEGSQPIDPNQSQSSQSAARLSTSSSSQSDVSVGVITVTVACVPFKEGTGQ